MSEPQVVNAFLRVYLQDRIEGGVHPLEHYQALFPRDEALIAEHYERCQQRRSEPGIEQQVAGFRIIREIGRGGQGVVYLAEDTKLGRRVALKMLNGVRALTPDALDRLLREARIASRLDHPGICAVYEASIDDGVPYIALQYVEGRTLAKEIATTKDLLTPRHPIGTSVSGGAPAGDNPQNGSSARSGDLDRKQILKVVEFVEKAARALHVAHEAGVVHRDVKPGNIMITPGGDAVLLDFGFARDEEADLSTLTRSGDWFGTPAYMSPEQLARETIRLDRRTDVWSLGVSLYEAITLRRPFEAPTRAALCQVIQTETPPDPKRLNPAIPKDLAIVLGTALEKDRDRRYQTAETFARDLRAVVEHRPVAAKPIGPAGRFARWARREPAKAGLVALALVALPVISVLVALRIQDLPRIEAERLADIQRRKEEHLAIGYLGLETYEETLALEHFNAAMTLEGGSDDAALGTALVHWSQKRPEDALNVLETHAARLAGRRADLVLRRQCLIMLGRESDSRPLDQFPPPREASDYFLEGLRQSWEARRTGNPVPVMALDAFSRAILLLRAPRLAFFAAAAVAAARVKDQAAFSRFEEGLMAHWPDSWVVPHVRGVALSEWNRNEEAITAYRESVRLKPDSFHSHYGLGIVLAKVGRPDEAIIAYEKALHIKPDPRAYCNLAWCLLAVGRFGEALTNVQIGNALGSRQPGWPYPSEEWLKKIARCVQLEQHMLEVAIASESVDNPRAMLELASLAAWTRRWSLAADWYATALARAPELAGLSDDMVLDGLPGRTEEEHPIVEDDENQRFHAARAAVQAGAGRGNATPMASSPRPPRELRDLALAWLRREIRDRQDLPAQHELRKCLESWPSDPLLAPVRDEASLATLAPDEAAAWRSFWDEVRAAAK